MARLIGICKRSASRAPMSELESAEITCAAGVEGDFRGTPGSRQVTVLAREAWRAACLELGLALPWTTRRANLLVEGLELEATVGRRLRVGGALLEITGETDPCARMEEQHAGLREALAANWRGGVCCRVLEAGAVRKGDEVRFETEAATSARA